MKWLGLICFFILMCYSGYPDRVKKLEKETEKLKAKIGSLKKSSSNFNRNGENEMSKLISELEGKKCIITFSNTFENLFDNQVECTVISVDDEWAKISYQRDVKKGEKQNVINIVRISNIESVEVYE